MEDEKTYYHRHLPHYQPLYAKYHVVFRLAESLPKNVIEELRIEKENIKNKSVVNIKTLQKSYFERFESLLNSTYYGPDWLKDVDVANVVKKAIEYRDGKDYDLLAYCIMPNHVHLIFELMKNDVCVKSKSINKNGRVSDSTYMVTKILESLKKYTALRSNRILKRSGNFWQHESYDHVVRDDNELESSLWYILCNPVKAGLVKKWDDWKWSYYKKGLI